MRAAEGSQIFFELNALVENVSGAQRDAFSAKNFVGHSTQHDRRASQTVALNHSEDFDAAHPGHANVEADDVRFEIANRFESFDAVAGSADDFQFGLKLAQTGETFPQLGRIIDNQDAGFP